MLWNTLLLALRAIRRNLLRSFLTTLGIVIGVAAVITMVSLGNAATESVTNQIRAMGTNQLTLAPGQRAGAGPSGAAPFRLEDVEAIREQIPGSGAVAPIVNVRVTAVYQARNWSTIAVGTSQEYFTGGNWSFAAGRAFNDAEERSGRAVCVLGETVRAALFGREDPVGTEVRLGAFACEVVGLLEAKGQAGFGSDQDDVIVLPVRTAQRRLAGNEDVGRISIAVRRGVSTEVVSERVRALLRERRGLAEREEDDFRIMDMRQVAETLRSTTRTLTGLLGAVAAVSLLVGGIGIMNIMLVSVTERTREIGIRLAIGALGHEVLLQFLIEAVVLSALGGLLGIALALGATTAVAGSMGLEATFDPVINAVAFVFSAGIGVVFGYFPARRAARLNPFDALRHE